ncbi:MAG: SDR family oxidoreductase [Bacteroidota bacterium]|nr:SDR family oxidoreductase [Bacteroidota bacterium]
MNIIVTGASRGIGYELVKKLVSSGDHKVIALSRNMGRLNQLKEEILQINKEAKINCLKLDLLDEHFHKSLLPLVKEKFEKVDVLINNAGLLVNKPFIEFRMHEFDEIFNVNVKSVVRLVQVLYPYFSNKAHIVNIGSMGGYQGSMKFPGLSLYSASKAALAVLSECLAEEFKDTGISVNCLALGAAQTEMLKEAFPDYQPPLSAIQMADFVCDFSLKGHEFFNGKILPVALTVP